MLSQPSQPYYFLHVHVMSQHCVSLFSSSSIAKYVHICQLLLIILLYICGLVQLKCLQLVLNTLERALQN